MRKQPLILIGGGGHCKSCIDVIEATGCFNIKGILDLKQKVGENILGYLIIGSNSDIDHLVKEKMKFLITVGNIGNTEKRMELYELVLTLGGSFATVIAPTAYVSRYAIVGQGTIIMHHAIANADSVIGNNCIINTRALVEHDTEIGDHCHISTGAIVNGGTKIGSNSFIGSGAITKQYITIPERSFVKAHSIVK